MQSISSYAHGLLIVTACLGAVTTLVGLCACPLESLPLQRAFLYLSMATFLGTIVSLVWHIFLPTPYQRVLRMGYGVVPLAGLWILLLVSCADSYRVREGSARTQMINNGKQIALGSHNFEEQYKQLPTDARDAANVPLLSWRVSLLPYMDQEPLLKQMNLTQSWDSPHNRPFVDKMPATYQSVLFPQSNGHTPWQGFDGPGTAFESGQKLRLREDFPDGLSNTIFVVEAQQHVIWSKPSDIPYGPGISLPPLGEPYPQRSDWPFCCPVPGTPRFIVCMADATVRMFNGDISEDRLRALIVRNDGKPQAGWDD
jgi:hypothetical protein